MQASTISSRDPKYLFPELERRMNMLFALYKEKFPNAPQPLLSQTVRSARDQAQDYAKGRSAPGPVITHANVGQSLHGYLPGMAFDVFFEEDGKYSENETYYSNLGNLAPSVGLDWGGDWIHSKDLPHFQPPNYTWEQASRGEEPIFPPITETVADDPTEEAFSES